MRLGWVFFFEIALVNIFLAALSSLYFPYLTWPSRVLAPKPDLAGAALSARDPRAACAITIQASQEHAPRADEGDDAVSGGEMGQRTCPSTTAARPPWSATNAAARRCVACQLCEFICPPRAITIIPGEIPQDDRLAKVEKLPEEFEIDMIRCIYCGMCEEVCPEQAIFLRKDYAITGFTRAEMVHDKKKLLEIGGVMHGVVQKWNEKK